jgi:hypothetical protein
MRLTPVLLTALALLPMLTACRADAANRDGETTTVSFNATNGGAGVVEPTATRLIAALRESAYWHTDPRAVQSGERSLCRSVQQADGALAGVRLSPDQSYVAEAARFLAEMCQTYTTNLARFTDTAGNVTSAADERRLVIPLAAHGHTPGSAAGTVTAVEMSAWEAESWIAQGSHRDACARLALYRRTAAGDSASVSFAAYCSLLCQ